MSKRSVRERSGEERSAEERSGEERVRIKFCGLVRPQDVETAVALRADFLGFVFVPGSPRQLDPRAAGELLAGCDTGAARRVGVFRDQPMAFVNEAIEHCRLDLVQLHGHEPGDYSLALHVPAIVVLRVPASTLGAMTCDDPHRLDAPILPPHVFAALVDAEDPSGRSGGLGLRPEGGALRRLLDQLPAGTRVFLSGGLTPENVAAIVTAHRPFAVDVSSGVESAPGVKDPARMRAFVRAVHEAREAEA